MVNMQAANRARRRRRRRYVNRMFRRFVSSLTCPDSKSYLEEFDDYQIKGQIVDHLAQIPEGQFEVAALYKCDDSTGVEECVGVALRTNEGRNHHVITTTEYEPFIDNIDFRGQQGPDDDTQPVLQ